MIASFMVLPLDMWIVGMLPEWSRVRKSTSYLMPSSSITLNHRIVSLLLSLYMFLSRQWDFEGRHCALVFSMCPGPGRMPGT